MPPAGLSRSFSSLTKRLAAVGVAVVMAATGPQVAGAIRVELEGVDGDEEKNVEAFLSIYREREADNLSEGRVRRLHDLAPGQIEEALAPFGRYRVQVQGELSPAPDGGWVARYRIEPGPAIPVGEVNVRITGEGSAEPNPPEVQLKTGEPFTHAAYESAKSKLKAFARERGYLDARFVQSGVEIDLEAYRADVALELETGPRFYFGEIAFEQEQFDPAFLRKFVDVAPGDPFSDRALLGLQGALINTDYFSQVEVSPRAAEAVDQRVPVDVSLTPNKPNRYRFGLGYGTDTGVRGVFDWTRRYIGTQGHSAGVELLLSPAIQRLDAYYRIPLEEPRKEFAQFRASAERYDTDSRKGTLASLRAEHNTFFEKWQQILAVDFDYEVPDDDAASESEYYNLIPNAAWTWKVLDDPIFTRRGVRADFKVQGAYDGALSSSSFLQGYARVKAIHPPLDDTRLIARAELGATLADSITDIPTSRRFYAGGDNSVRGYAYEELSPELPNGEKTGGKHLAFASLEVDRRVTGNWFAAAFVDVGNAFNDFGEMDLKPSAGVGVRWLSPIGLIRFDVAKPLEDDGDVRIHLVIGPDL
jgi:translocation and assembly module TamA